jgi:hypothetical protein
VISPEDFDALRRIADDIRRYGEDVGYGYYPGGDPRDFHPDPECCSTEEYGRWQEACAAWERGETPDPGGPHKHFEGGHVTVAHYGLGTYTMRDETLSRLAQDLDDLTDAIRSHE